MNTELLLKKRWFSPSLIKDSFKAVKWLPMKTTKAGKEGLMKKFWKTVLFMAVSALIFAVLDAITAFALPR